MKDTVTIGNATTISPGITMPHYITRDGNPGRDTMGGFDGVIVTRGTEGSGLEG